MVNPVEWLATASQLFQTLPHLVLVLVAGDLFSVFLDQIGHVDDCLPHLVNWFGAVEHVVGRE